MDQDILVRRLFLSNNEWWLYSLQMCIDVLNPPAKTSAKLARAPSARMLLYKCFRVELPRENSFARFATKRGQQPPNEFKPLCATPTSLPRKEKTFRKLRGRNNATQMNAAVDGRIPADAANTSLSCFKPRFVEGIGRQKFEACHRQSMPLLSK